MSVALGIDRGTTNSVAAIATPAGVECILGVAVGTDARRYRLSEPGHVIHAAKRFIGQNLRAPMVQLALTGVRYQVVGAPSEES